MKTQITLAALLFATVPALADQAAGDTCAAGLGGEAKAIYAAAAPGFAGAPDARAYITDKTKGLVMSGQVSRGTARSAAEAAATCLNKLR